MNYPDINETPHPLDQDRPKSPKVFGILHIVLASLSILLIVVFLILGLMSSRQGEITGPAEQVAFAKAMRNAQEEVQNLPYVRLFQIVSLVYGIGSLALLMLSGILLVRYRRAGRTLALLYATTSLILGQAINLFNTLYVNKQLYMLVSGQPGVEERFVSITQSFMMGVSISTGLCCLVVHPLLILIFMLPARFAESLEPKPGPDDEDGPGATPANGPGETPKPLSE